MSPSDRIVERRRIGATNFNLIKFVDQVADQFEKAKRGSVTVSSSARHELVTRMKPHEGELQDDLATGKMSVKELTQIMADVLLAAHLVKRVARMGRNPSTGAPVNLVSSRIGRESVAKAMKWKCRYLGWC